MARRPAARPTSTGWPRGACALTAPTRRTSPCSPARAALFTGLYPHKNHVRVNDGTLNPDVPTLASELGAAGYNLGYAGKWHVDAAQDSHRLRL